MGTVYLAQHERTDNKAAVKFCDRRDAGLVHALQAEAAALASINVAGVVDLLDSGETSDHAWIATSWVHGPSLRRYLTDWRAGPVASEAFDDFDSADDADDEVGHPPVVRPSGRELRKRVGWFRDLARALHAMEELDALHRDVKPDNIVLAQELVPFLIDFGLAADVDDPSLRGRLAGTYAYMSPEQAAGFVALDTRSDQFSLAATFFEAVTGERLRGHHRHRDAALREIHLERTASRLDRVPRSLRPIFRTALARDANARYASFDHLAHDLECWLEHDPLVHTPLALPERVLYFFRGRPLRTGLVGLAAVLALVLLATILWRLRELSLRIEHIDDLLEQGRASSAMSALAKGADDLGSHASYPRLVRLATALGARDRAVELFQSQTFTIADPALESRHVAWAEEARVLRRVVPEDPELVFHIAFSSLLQNRVDDARTLLEAHPELVARSPLLIQLQALLLTAAGEVDRAREVLAGAESAATDTRRDRDLETCFAAYRVVWQIGARTVPRGTLAEIEGRLDTIIAARPEYDLARTLRCRLRMKETRYEEALHDADRLKAKATTVAERIGTHAMAALAAAHAGAAMPERRQDCFSRSVNDIVVCLRTRPDAIGQIGRRLDFAPELRLAWLELCIGATGPPHVDRELGETLWGLARDLYGGDACELLARLDPLVPIPPTGRLSEELVNYRVFLAIGLLELGLQEASTARLERARAMCADEIARGIDHPTDFEFIGLRASGEHALMSGDAQAARATSSAIRALQDRRPAPKDYEYYEAKLTELLQKLDDAVGE